MNAFRVIKSLFFIVSGIILIWITIQKIDYSDFNQAIQACYTWKVVPILMASIGVVLVRAKRWQLLYKNQDVSVSLPTLFHVLNTGYLVNFAVPRLGELSRAFLLKNKQQIPFNRSIASIVFERLSDLIVLALILSIAIILEYFLQFGVINHLVSGVQLNRFKVLILLGFTAFLSGFIIYYWRNIKDKAGIWTQELINYFSRLITMKDKPIFLALTIGIWVGFYLMTMLWIFIFPDTTQLSFYACFEVMLVGVLARTLPIQAGSAGAYHFAVSNAFVYFGLNQSKAFTLALMIHGFQSILTILLGILSYIWFIYQQRNA